MRRFWLMAFFLASVNLSTARECINSEILPAKIIVANETVDSYQLAYEFLQRAAIDDETGESHFYMAVLEHRLRLENRALASLQESAGRDYHFAHAFFRYAYEEEFMGVRRDLAKSNTHSKKFKESMAACSEFLKFENPDVVAKSLLLKLFSIYNVHNK